MAADRALDLLGRVGARRDAALAGGEQHDAAGLADGERGPDVGAEVQLLDRDRVGVVRVEQLPDAGVDVGQPALERDARRGSAITPSSSARRREPALCTTP